MPLQNRVTPFGEITALPGRGLFTGNRGVLHDEAQHIVRHWTSRRWIACVLEYKGIRRRVMTPHRWTELFFLDEATALAAGHRPCAECRRPAYRQFRSLWESLFGGPVSAEIMDARIDSDRREGRRKRTYKANAGDLPDGVFVAIDDRAWLLWNGHLHAWSDRGYTDTRAIPTGMTLEVLTPRSIAGVLGQGYSPLVHPSANER